MPTCVVVTQKVVSKAEGRLVELASVEPSPLARDWAEQWGKDARQVELVLRESAEIVRMVPGGLIISRTRHGLVCANAGVDVSNVGGGEIASLLPHRPGCLGRSAPGGVAPAPRRRAGRRHQRLVRAAVAQRDRQRGDRRRGNRGAPRPSWHAGHGRSRDGRQRSSRSPMSWHRPRISPAARSTSDRSSSCAAMRGARRRRAHRSWSWTGSGTCSRRPQFGTRKRLTISPFSTRKFASTFIGETPGRMTVTSAM